MRSSGAEAIEWEEPPAARSASADRGERLVLELVGSHSDALLRTARRYSLCADDAHDAYQRGLEILMRHATRLDPDRAAAWLHTVVKHEALAINRSRRRMLGHAELDPDALEERTAASPEERMLASDRVARSAEALHGLKPQEVRALWLKALGHSYQQIAEATGWTYTKVNRCLAEGRRSFLTRYAGIESGEACKRLAPAMSAFVDGEADASQAMALRVHLRQCIACRAAVRGLHDASRPLEVVFPAAGLALGGGGADHAGSLFMRVYETVTLQLHERTANSILRAQAIIDMATAGKMAAVAASAAAAAGGGMAVEGAVTSADDGPSAAIVRADGGVRSGHKTRPATHGRRTTHRRAGASTSGHATRSPPPARRRAHAAVQSRHVAPPRPSSTPPQRSATPPQPSPSAPSAPAATPRANASVAAAGSGGSSGGAAAGEFGFEGP